MKYIISLFIMAGIVVQAQQLKLPALSPTATITQAFSTSEIEISYSRPSMRGRVIFGDLVPYGKVWRTGANAATKVTFGEEVEIGGSKIQPGTYSMYTVPGATEWEVIFNRNTGNWGAYGYSKDDDVARFKVKPSTLVTPVETFTIAITSITFASCNIELSWERTKVIIPVIAHNQERLNKQIEQAINNPSIPYHQAATYYFETNQNLDKALEYATKAGEANPKAYWVFMLKARIAAKLGDKETARESVATAINVAKGSADEAGYAKMGKEILDSLK